MKRFVIRRLIVAILLLFASSIIVFYSMRAAPGAVTTQLVNPVNSYSKYLVPNIKHKLGLDRPLLTQYALFMKNTLSGNPGISLISGDPITRIIASAGKYTLELAGAAAILTYVLAIPLGVAAAGEELAARSRGD